MPSKKGLSRKDAVGTPPPSAEDLIGSATPSVAVAGVAKPRAKVTNVISQYVMELPNKGWFGTISNIVGQPKDIPHYEINAKLITYLSRDLGSTGGRNVKVHFSGSFVPIFCKTDEEVSLIIEFIRSVIAE